MNHETFPIVLEEKAAVSENIGGGAAASSLHVSATDWDHWIEIEIIE